MNLPVLESSAMGRVTIIYGLADPETGHIRYVGKAVHGLPKRLYQHLWQARTAKRKRHVLAWISSVVDKGVKPEIFEIERVPAGGDWEEAEAFWIAYFRFIGADLCNLTSGGEGAPGWKCPPERIERLRARCGPLSPLFGRPKPPHVHEALRLGNEKKARRPSSMGRQ
ncbi:hypothetical protein [Bradyrhizobium japonicum]|uniref:hypothetical protein n=1 Tax=Bradyrhizobium japonicum TaxID=375 RepID=UPI001AEC50CC|nr:hypothetical protein [Bradyrhizobium japonicum]